eukprot:3935418-Rhodomonas_salina.1
MVAMHNMTLSEDMEPSFAFFFGCDGDVLDLQTGYTPTGKSAALMWNFAGVKNQSREGSVLGVLVREQSSEHSSGISSDFSGPSTNDSSAYSVDESEGEKMMECSGISLFSRTENTRDTMTADFVGGMTMLSYAEDDLSENDTANESCYLEDEEEPLSNQDMVDLWNVMTNCAGLTLFGRA